MKNIESSIIITEENGLIISANSFAKINLKEKELNGKNISIYLELINKKKSYICNLGNYVVYVFSGIGKDCIEQFLEGINIPFALFDTNGNLSYFNNAFQDFFSDLGNGVWRKINLIDIIEKYGENKISISLIKKIKKDIEIKLNMESGYSVGKIRFIKGDNDELIAISFSCDDVQVLAALEEKLLLEKEKIQNIKEDILDNKQNIDNPKNINKDSLYYSTAMNIATKDITVLILGESGTGKSFLAKQMHEMSYRKKNNFVTINCASIPESLIESELFGYEKGAFTGASDLGKKGLVEVAEGGTLFLDEIAELPLSVQSKFLHLIQEREFTPVGGTVKKKVDLRIITATNRDIEDEVRNKRFRQDLYYRIAVATIVMPPIRERLFELDKLIKIFMNRYNKKYNLGVCLSKQANDALLNYSWPGNIRELENLLEFLVVSNDGEIKKNMLPLNVLENEKQWDKEYIEETYEIIEYDKIMDSYEKELINKYYKKYSSSYKLAEALSISQTKANRLIKKHIDKSK